MASKKGGTSNMTISKKNRHKQLIKELYQVIDRNRNGKVSYDELKMAFSCQGSNPTEKDMIKVMNEFNVKKGDEIGFDKFSACLESYFEAAEDKDKETERKLLEAAFDRFDKDKSGYFDKAELKNMLVSCGEKVTDKDIDNLFKLADESKDGKLHKHEVTKIFLKDMK